MKFYLMLLAISNIFMLYVADLFLFFNCTRIADTIVCKANKNTNYIEECIKE